MKTILTTGFTFAAATRRLDFTAMADFDPRRLLAVINVTRGVLIYACGERLLGYSGIAARVITLTYDTTAQADADVLSVMYEAPSDNAVGKVDDAAWNGAAGSASQISILKAIWARLAKVVLQIGGNDVAAGNPLPTADANNAAFAAATPLAAGAAAVAAGRSVGVDATAAGRITLNLAAGGTISLLVGVGWQTFPFQATGFAFAADASGSVAAGTVLNLA